MKMSRKDKEIIEKNAHFISAKGFKSTENDYGIDYFSDEIKISIYYEKYGTAGLIGIRFVKENVFFDIGWIALVRENIQLSSEKPLENILILLDFMKENFDCITNYNYCKESDQLIDDYCVRLIESNPKYSEDGENIKKLINHEKYKDLS